MRIITGGQLINNRACYETDNNLSPWVHRPKDENGHDLPRPAPSSITNEDRFRGIRRGTLWEYIKDVDLYHCPGDNRHSTQSPPRDAFRSYSISYAFGSGGLTSNISNSPYRSYLRLSEVERATHYYVFVEEEHNASNYGENEGGWDLPFGGGRIASIVPTLGPSSIRWPPTTINPVPSLLLTAMRHVTPGATRAPLH